MESYFYKKLWDFTTFNYLMNEELTKDEIYFYLQQRNILFNGPELRFQSATFDVITYVKLETVLKLALKQFSDKESGLITRQFRSIKDILTEKSSQKGKYQMVDAYFALRIFLEFYKSEKKIYLRKLKQSFEVFSEEKKANNLIEKDIKLEFGEFREFIQETFKVVNHSETLELYRLAFNFGNGSVNFDNFVAAAHEKNLFSQLLVMDSTVFALVHTAEQALQQNSDMLLSLEKIKEVLENNKESLYKSYDDIHKIGVENWMESMKNITEFIDLGNDLHNRNDTVFQKDPIIWLTFKLISFLKGVIVIRNSLESSKFLNTGFKLKEKSQELRNYMIEIFSFITENFNPDWITEEIDKEWIGTVFVRFQNRVRQNLKFRKIKFIQENVKRMIEEEKMNKSKMMRNSEE